MMNGQMGGSEEVYRTYSLREIKPVAPKDWPIFPNKNIGDRFYYTDGLEEGVQEYIVVGKDKAGHCLIAEVYSEMQVSEGISLSIPEYANRGVFETIEECLRDACKSDTEYYAKRLAYAKEITDAIAKKKDLSKYLLPKDFYD